MSGLTLKPYKMIPTFPIGPRVKVYIALLNQSGTNAPEATVLQNTFGKIIWTREAAGLYIGTLTDAFTNDKTVIPPFGSLYTGNTHIMLPLSDDSAISGYYYIQVENNDRIAVETRNDTFIRTEMSNIVAGTPLYIEIVTYN